MLLDLCFASSETSEPMKKRKFVLGLWRKLSKEVSKTNSLRLRTRRARRGRPISNYFKTKEALEDCATSDENVL